MSIIPLDIAIEYPVDWNLKRILRDLIQNFYDSIGYEHFAEEFHYTWQQKENGRYDIEMKVYGHPFSYEWLAYVGGSTKTNSPGDYIGMYGEGFKMCMLCIERSRTMTAIMESQNWKITSCRYIKKIEEKEIQMLGYDLKERIDDGWTKLTLRDIPWEWNHQDIIDEALLEFFFPENRLFGKKIYENDKCSIYKRSDEEIPCRNYYRDFRGVLYCNYLARGRLPFPVILLVREDMRAQDTRNREVLEEEEVIELLEKAFQKFDAQSSYAMLEMMKPYWEELPAEMVDFNTWYYAICQLVRNISKDDHWSEKFKKKYTNLVYFERKSGDILRNKLIDETKVWHAEMKREQIVNPIFRLLGAKSLVEEYKKIKAKLFVIPTESERKRIEMLFQILNVIFPYQLYDERPEVVIQVGKQKYYKPLLFAERKYYKRNIRCKRRYIIRKVVMSHDDFKKDMFVDTLVKFADILIHAYGATRNAKVNIYLTYLGEACIKHRKLIEQYSEVWNARE